MPHEKIGLFIPCYIDAFFPKVGIATLELLEKCGQNVEYPMAQTCCGQPLTNVGCHSDAAEAEALFVRHFVHYDAIVVPSGSCAHHVRDRFEAIPQTEEVRHVRSHTYELVEFLHDILKIQAFPWAEFPHKVGIHHGCSTLRSLRTASMSELGEPFFSKPQALLSRVKGVSFVTLQRPDECCGFGGTFSITEEAVSIRMGLDKVQDHYKAGAEYIVSTDSSCLMHQQGCAESAGIPIRFIHIAEILNGAQA